MYHSLSTLLIALGSSRHLVQVTHSALVLINNFPYLYHGSFKPSNQISQFAVNIFHTRLLGDEWVNCPKKFFLCVSCSLEPWYKSVAPLLFDPGIYTSLSFGTIVSCHTHLHLMNPILVFLYYFDQRYISDTIFVLDSLIMFSGLK